MFDVDDDGDVDQLDFGVFQACLTGVGGEGFETLPIECQCMDRQPAPYPDGDQAISQEEFLIFQRCATGPSIGGLDPDCDDPPF